MRLIRHPLSSRSALHGLCTLDFWIFGLFSELFGGPGSGVPKLLSGDFFETFSWFRGFGLCRWSERSQHRPESIGLAAYFSPQSNPTPALRATSKNALSRIAILALQITFFTVFFSVWAWPRNLFLAGLKKHISNWSGASDHLGPRLTTSAGPYPFLPTCLFTYSHI